MHFLQAINSDLKCTYIRPITFSSSTAGKSLMLYLALVKTKHQCASILWNSIKLITPRDGTYPKQFLCVSQNPIFLVNYEVCLECFKLRDRRHHLDAFF